MKHKLFILGYSFLISFLGFSQTDSGSVYKNLKTKKFYAVNLSYQGFQNKGSFKKSKKYEVNDKQVNRRTYQKYKRRSSDISNCCPCILKAFDEFDTLLWVGVSCTDCRVGWYKEYYRNGKVKVSGQYKENPTQDWKDIFYKGYCNVEHGKWEYYNESGDTLYSEFWKNGLFLEQIPEQQINEIWKIDLVLKDTIVSKDKRFTIDQISELEIVPKYKNSSLKKPKLTIEVEVSAIGARRQLVKLTPETFKDIDVRKMILDAKIPEGNKISFEIAVYKNDTFIRRFYLEILE